MSSPSCLFRLSPIAAAMLAFHAMPASAEATADAAATTTLSTVKVEDSAASDIKADQVASPKFTQPLVDTPQTISVLKKELLIQQGALSLSDALRQTPGITFQQGENGNSTSGDAVFLRGFDTQGSIFLDNIRDISPAVRDLFNIEQVEIVKGPAGADNGRGVAAGYINLVSKTPFADDLATGSFSYGTRDRRRATADINRRIGDTVAVRLNVVGQDGGVAGRDVVERQQWGLAPSISFGLGTPTRVTLFTQHLFQDNIPDGGVTALGVSGYRSANANAASAAAAPISNFYGLDADFEDIDLNVYSLRLEHDLAPGYTVSNLSRYSRTTQDRVLTAPLNAPTTNGDPSTWTVARSRQGSYRDNDLLTNQTNLRGVFRTGVLKHEFSSGIEFIHEAQYTPTYAVTVTTPAQAQTPANVYNPNPSDPAVTVTPNGAFSDGDTTTAAAYFFDTAKFGAHDQFQLNAGVRIERYRTETDLLVYSTATTFPNLAVGTPVTARPVNKDTLLSYKVGGVYKPLDNGSLYAAYGTSQRPPGGDNFTLSANTVANINGPTLEPSEADSVEVGSKWDLLDGRFAANAALFRTVSRNDLARQVDDSIVQYGKRRVQGVELGLVGNLTANWQLSAGYTHQNTKVAEGVIATDGTSTQSGAPINFSPKDSVTVWSSYKLPVALGAYLNGPLTLGGGVRYLSSQSRTVNNNPDSITTGIVTVDDYVVVDAVAGYDFTPKVGLQANVYNLLDERYVASVNNSGQRYSPGIPRSYLLTLNVRY
ncbi:MAG: catecholate siderophore receptor Fiu [Gammaproteobacteria bacterium]|nr:catecholate siderophore receptor Fiu [Gammaproteobacteria bacterium]